MVKSLAIANNGLIRNERPKSLMGYGRRLTTRGWSPR